MEETHIELAETPEDLDRIMGYVLDHEVVRAMIGARISRCKILESAALESFIDNRHGPEVEQMRQELRYLREHGRFFFATQDN